MIEVQTGSIKKVVKDADYGIVYGARLDYSVQQVYHENKSYITAKLYYLSDVNSTWIGDRTHTVKINGVSQTINFTGYKDLRNGEVLVGTVTQAVSHNSDGNKTVAISFTYDLNKAWKGTNYATLSASKSVTLNRIPRPSTMSFAATTELGKSLAITITREASDFTHTLSYTIGSIKDSVIFENVGTSKTWTIPVDIAAQITDSTSGILGIKCTTYDGEGNLLGSTSKSVLVTVPESVIPTISTVGFTDPTGCLAKYGAVVQGKSKLAITVNGVGAYGSTIKSYTHISPYFRTTDTTQKTYTTDVIYSDNVDAFSHSVKVKDSRGRESAWLDSTINNLSYNAPTISTFKAVRCTANGVEDDGGEYIKVTMAGSITALNNINSKKFTLQYKKKADTSYTTAQTYTSYTLNTSAMFAAEINSSYDVQLLATDDFSTTTRTAKVNTAYTLVDYNASGKGMAIGKASEKDAFEVELPTIFTGATSPQFNAAPLINAAKVLFKLADGVNDSAIDFYSNTFHIANTTKAGDYSVWIGDVNKTTTIFMAAPVDLYKGLTVAGYLKAPNIELLAATPFIDFHYGSSTADYTSRIIENSSGHLNVIASNGVKTSADFEVGGNIIANGLVSFKTSTYTSRFYNNGSATYLLLTNSGGTDANSLRPLTINNSTGYVTALKGFGVNIVPDETDKRSLGSSTSLRFNNIYAKTSTIASSDENAKKDIEEIDDKYNQLYDKLIPVTYKFKDGERIHLGFISQRVEEAMNEVGLTDMDFAGFCKDKIQKEVITKEAVFDADGNMLEDLEKGMVDALDEYGNAQYTYGLRYEEFIALNTDQIQKLKKKVNVLEDSLEKALARIEALEAKLATT